MTKMRDEDEWFKVENLQDEIDMLLRKYEKKGIVVEKINIYFPSYLKNPKPQVRIQLSSERNIK